LRHVIQKEGRGAGGSAGEDFERQRMQQAAEDAAKKLEDATKEAEETARVAAAQATFGDFGVQQVRGLLDIYGQDIEKGGQL
jgi:hypothetical protein